MTRTQIYLNDKQKKGIQLLMPKFKKSQSELIRIAIDKLIEDNNIKNKDFILKNVFGIWKNNDTDFEALRRDWDRY